MVIGAQLYTVRQFTKTLEDFAETLKKVADIGYTTVQVSGTCAFEADWLRDRLSETGLSCVITHTNPTAILEETEKVCRDHDVFGCRNIGIGIMPGAQATDGRYEQFVENYLPAAKKMQECGHKLFYHNHALEFERSADGRVFMERFLEDFSPELLGITFDTYWAQFAGADPAAWIERLKGRVECIHLKDLAVVGNTQRMAPVGGGNMNFDRILAAAEKASAEYLLVEQDDCYGEDPFDCLKKSYQYLTSVGLK